MRRISLEKSLVASVLVALIAVLPAPTSRAAKLKEGGTKSVEDTFETWQVRNGFVIRWDESKCGEQAKC